MARSRKRIKKVGKPREEGSPEEKKDIDRNDEFGNNDEMEIENNNEMMGEENSKNFDKLHEIRSPSKCRFKSINKRGKEAEAGVITRVHVENFMCHRKLKVDLCRNVNFIYGQNGSGKSAILAAIQICLGAGARRTHRARNLKDLIRKEAGQDVQGAKIRVEILNEGSDGYRRDVYGDRIVVERCISRSGYNGYKLLGADMKEKSRLRKDLDEMLDQLNIQVENPVVVLDQEEAKKFLNGKAESKYDFFMKATELERMDRHYATTADNIDVLEALSNKQKKDLSGAESEVKRLEQQWKECQELDQMEDKIADFKVKYAWSLYNHQCQTLKEQESILKNLESKKRKKLDELESFAKDDSGEEETALKDRIEELAKEAQVVAKLKRELDCEYRSHLEPVKKLEVEKKNLKRNLKDAKRRYQQASKRLQDTRRQILETAGAAESEEAKRTQNLMNTESKLKEAKETLTSLKEEVSLAHKYYEELEPRVENAKNNHSTLNSKHFAINKKLRDLQSSEANSVSVFGQKCALMQRKVGETRFKGPVIGPLGAFIKIVPGKEHLAKIAELAIGNGVLDRFIVTNAEDRQTFDRLRRSLNCRSRDCNVFEQEVENRYPVPTPPSGVDTVASVLNITNDVVFNCLVNNANIDLIAVSESKGASERALLGKDNRGRDIIKCGKIRRVYFLPDGDFWQINSGNRTMISNDRGAASLRQSIGIDRSEAILQIQSELEEIDIELKDAKEFHNKKLREQKNTKIKWNELNRSARQQTKFIEDLQDRLETLRSEAEVADNVVIDTTELEEDVATAEDEIEQINQKEVEIRDQIDQLSPAIQEIESRKKQNHKKSSKIDSDLQKTENNLETYVKIRTINENKLEKKREKIETLSNTIELQMKNIADASETVDRYCKKAKSISLTINRKKQSKSQLLQQQENDMEAENDEELENIQPVRTERESNHYKAKIDQMNRKLERERTKRGINDNPDILFEKYQRGKSDLDSKLVTIEKTQENANKLRKDLKSRKKLWKDFRDSISYSTDTLFDGILNRKGSSGSLDIIHKDRTLNLTVQKDNTNQNSQTKDVKSLSGGEKSYATLALLLALGESIETPFRVMDEFDVYLDPVSRKIALDTMIETAKSMAHRQFIFITPQDLSALTQDPNLRIIRLRAPERNKNASGLIQQTF